MKFNTLKASAKITCVYHCNYGICFKHKKHQAIHTGDLIQDLIGGTVSKFFHRETYISEVIDN